MVEWWQVCGLEWSVGGGLSEKSSGQWQKTMETLSIFRIVSVRVAAFWPKI